MSNSTDKETWLQAAFVSTTTTSRRSNKYEASQTMDRLRNDLVGANHTKNGSTNQPKSGYPRESCDAIVDTPLLPQEKYKDEEMTTQCSGYQTLHDAYKYSSITPLSASMKLDASDHHSNGSKLLDRSFSSMSYKKSSFHCIQSALHQIPAISLITIFHLMIAVPFGVSYFPVGWKARHGVESSESDQDNDGVNGEFPIEGKEALGIRMFLFATVVGQIVMTFTSKFSNPIAIQMVENTPFCHTLSRIVISKVGYGIEALSTLIVMFGLSSLIVGIVFFTMGKMKLGRIVYFFPVHVLVGCIGGIGIYISKTGLEVAMNQVFSIQTFLDTWHLWSIALMFEVLLRLLQLATRTVDGKPRWALLSPIYFCLITPMFYAGLFLLRIDLHTCKDAGYFFPSLDQGESICDGDECSESVFEVIRDSFFNKDVFDMWRFIKWSNVSYAAIVESIPTLISLTLFSLIHVPINIPAFAVSSDVEADMNAELISHGYANMISGCAGGLQVYMAYTQSVLYDRSGGSGKVSGIIIAILTSLLLFIGPTIASFIPKAMAATLLIHVGIDLFLEGVWDSYGKFDKLEYSGIWLIVVVMTVNGMDAAMIAGAIAAVSTYAVQTITYLHPIRGTMSAATLRSSIRNRAHQVNDLLDSDEGRSRIKVIQLQGHIFFGNCATLNEYIMNEMMGTDDLPWIVIMDCSLVLGIDSSAAQAIVKLKNGMLKNGIATCAFVTGSHHGFPCEYKLSNELSDNAKRGVLREIESYTETSSFSSDQTSQFTGSHVFESLDLALAFSENALVAKMNPDLLDKGLGSFEIGEKKTITSLEDEREIALHYLTNICPDEANFQDIVFLFSHFTREVYKKDDYVWRQGSNSDCAKLLVKGWLVAVLENEAGTSETIQPGNLIGELGLCRGIPRMSSVHCTEEAIVYSINRQSLEDLKETNPKVANFFSYICITYLVHRLQHVSNRIFETRCLPI